MYESGWLLGWLTVSDRVIMYCMGAIPAQLEQRQGKGRAGKGRARQSRVAVSELLVVAVIALLNFQLLTLSERAQLWQRQCLLLGDARR